jgi:hypothetical protein
LWTWALYILGFLLVGEIFAAIIGFVTSQWHPAGYNEARNLRISSLESGKTNIIIIIITIIICVIGSTSLVAGDHSIVIYRAYCEVAEQIQY